MSRYDEKEKRTLAVYTLIFFMLAAGIVISGYVSYRNFEQQFHDQAERQLSAIAQLKVNDLVSWRKERLADAELLHQNLVFAALVQAHFEDSNDALAQAQIQGWLDNYRIYTDYDYVRLLDAKGQTSLSNPSELPPISAVVVKRIPEVLQSKQMVLFDFYRRENDGQIRLSLLIPILDVQTGDLVIGIVAISINPEIYLYPFIKVWPINSATAETLLVRREGNDVLFLNELRFDPNAALTLRFPLTDTEIPAVKAVLGENGVAEGLDYRGVPVLADMRAVPDSPWFLVSKMDIAEVYAPLSARLWQTLGLVGMAIFLAGMGLMTFWRQQRILFYRTQAEAAEALRESERQLRESQIIAGVGSYRFDFSNGTWSSSDVLDHIFGIDKAFERSIASWAALIHPDNRQQMTDYFTNEVIGKRAHFDKEYKILRNNDGVERWVHGIGKLEFDAQNQLVYMLGTIQDITERRLAEESLRDSEETLRLAFSAGRMGSWDRNFLSGQLNWSVECKAMFGLAPEIEMNDERFMHALHPEDRASTDLAVREAIEKHTDFSAEYRVIWPDGTIHWIAAQGHGYYNEDGQAIRMSGITFDITERKQMEDALQASELRFRLAAESLIDFIYEWDLKDRVDWYGDIDRIMGYPTGEFPRTLTGWSALLHPDDKETIFSAIDGQLKGSAPYKIEYRIRNKNDEWRWWSARGTALKDERGEPYRWIGSITDITERKQAEQQLAGYTEHLEEVVNERTRELRDAQEQLVRQERLATLGQLAGSIGHELRNPLGVISNAIYFLKMAQPNASDQVKEYLTIIENEARTSDKIVTDLLDFTRIKSVEREAVSVSKIISQTLNRFPVPASIKVTLDIPSDLPLIFADPHHVVQILGNLTVNAYQSMGPNRGSVEISAASHNDMVSIVVHDHGLGISPDNMDKLFEPLFTTKTKGIGLGLAVSKKLIEANGGRIEVESEAEVGATFTIWLPVHGVTASGS